MYSANKSFILDRCDFIDQLKSFPENFINGETLTNGWACQWSFFFR